MITVESLYSQLEPMMKAGKGDYNVVIENRLFLNVMTQVDDKKTLFINYINRPVSELFMTKEERELKNMDVIEVRRLLCDFFGINFNQEDRNAC